MQLEDEWLEIYSNIKYILTKSKNTFKEHKCACILGGQPGAGKSTFYQSNTDYIEYIIIDADTFRKWHPNYEDIVKYDYENFAERTQKFVNRITEKLISELSEEGYNILIEGTLRTKTIPLETFRTLSEKGYTVELVVVAENANKAWNNTLLRAKAEYEHTKVPPRLVPIDKYNAIIHHLVDNLKYIIEQDKFERVSIFYDNKMFTNSDLVDYLDQILDVKNWDENYDERIREYFQTKKEYLELSYQQYDYER